MLVGLVVSAVGVVTLASPTAVVADPPPPPVNLLGDEAESFEESPLPWVGQGTHVEVASEYSRSGLTSLRVEFQPLVAGQATASVALDQHRPDGRIGDVRDQIFKEAWSFFQALSVEAFRERLGEYGLVALAGVDPDLLAARSPVARRRLEEDRQGGPAAVEEVVRRFAAEIGLVGGDGDALARFVLQGLPASGAARLPVARAWLLARRAALAPSGSSYDLGVDPPTRAALREALPARYEDDDPFDSDGLDDDDGPNVFAAVLDSQFRNERDLARLVELVRQRTVPAGSPLGRIILEGAQHLVLVDCDLDGIADEGGPS